jgi:uncharacterized protein
LNTINIAIDLTIAQQQCSFDAEKALFWHAESTLFIADVHLGKVSHFRQAGVSLGADIDGGATAATFARLDALINRYASTRIIFLGDLLHSAAIKKSADTLNALIEWRGKHRAITMTLIRGNHDDRAGDPPAAADIQCVDEPLLIAPFAACHYPDTAVPVGYHALAGHIHPAVRLSSKSDSARVACLWSGANVTVLPAFGEFTGTYVVKPVKGDQVVVVADRQVMRVA